MNSRFAVIYPLLHFLDYSLNSNYRTSTTDIDILISKILKPRVLFSGILKLLFNYCLIVFIMLIIPHIFNSILEKKKKKLLSLTSPPLPPKKGAECLSSGDSFCRCYYELMLQYIETYKGTRSKQNVWPRRLTNFEKPHLVC